MAGLAFGLTAEGDGILDVTVGGGAGGARGRLFVCRGFDVGSVDGSVEEDLRDERPLPPAWKGQVPMRPQRRPRWLATPHTG